MKGNNTGGYKKKGRETYEKDCQSIFFHLICCDLCCSWLCELHTGTSEDGRFISLCRNGHGHMEGKGTEEAATAVSLSFFTSLTLQTVSFTVVGTGG